MLHLQKFLIETNGDLETLKTEYGVYASPNKNIPNLIQFSYDQIEAAKIKNHPLVRESRGIILNSWNWDVVARPFDRFFNWGENVDEDIFNWKSFVAQEKIDGSLMILYNYENNWYVATKGSPDAGGNVGDYEFSFAELFWKTFNRSGIKLENLEAKNTYLLELTSKYNRVVTTQQNNEGSLQLIGVRETETGIEYPVELFSEIMPVVAQYNMNTIEEILEASKQLNPVQQEGFVLVDSSFNRIKVKSEKYVLIHHLKNTLNPETIISLIQTGEESEVLAYFPDLQEMFWMYENIYRAYSARLDGMWESIPENLLTGTRKEFAKYVLQNFDSFSIHYFFSRLDGKASNANHWLAQSRAKNILEYFKGQLSINN